MFRITLGSILTLMLIGGIARADHTLPSGTMSRLQQDTRQLYYSVRNSSLNYQVKRSVYDFAYDVDSLVRCIQMGRESHENGDQRDHDVIPEHCEYQIRYVHYSWRAVDRYLWDTAFDYPYVYHYYLRVRDDIRYLPNPH